jgi:hypothetical protein
MRAVSLHRFLPGQLVARVAASALLTWVVLIVLLAFGVTGVAAPRLTLAIENPFRWYV